MNWKKKYKKVIKELNEYIEWNQETKNNTNLKLNPPLIWDIYYEKYNYNFHYVHLHNVFVRDGSLIIKMDFEKIYKEYVSDDYYISSIEPFIVYPLRNNDILQNMKYELVLLLDVIRPIQIHILTYLIC